MGQDEDIDDWLCLTNGFHLDGSSSALPTIEVSRSSNSVVIEKYEGNGQAHKKTYLTLDEISDIHSKLLDFDINLPPFPVKFVTPSWYSYFFQEIPSLDDNLCLQLASYFKTVYSVLDNDVLDHIIFMEDLDIAKYFKDLRNNDIDELKKKVDVTLIQLSNYVNESHDITSCVRLKEIYDTEDKLMLDWQRALSHLYNSLKLPLYGIRDPATCQSAIKNFRSNFQQTCDGSSDDFKIEKLKIECHLSKLNIEFFSKTVASYKSAIERIQSHFSNFKEEPYESLIANRFDRLSAEMSKEKVQMLRNQRHILKLKLCYIISQDSNEMDFRRCNDLKIKIFKKRLEIKKELLARKLLERKKMKKRIKSAYSMLETFYDAQMEFCDQDDDDDDDDEQCSVINHEPNISEEIKILDGINTEISTLGSSIARIRLKIITLTNDNIDADKNSHLTEVQVDMGDNQVHPGQVIFSHKMAEFHLKNVFEQPGTSSIPPPPPPPPILIQQPPRDETSPPKKEKKLVEIPREKEQFLVTLSMLSDAKAKLKKSNKVVQPSAKDTSGFVITTSQLATQLAKLKPTQACDKVLKPKPRESDQFNFLREAMEKIRISVDSTHEDEDQSFDEFE